MEKAKLEEELNRLDRIITNSFEATTICQNKLQYVNKRISSPGRNGFSLEKSNFIAEKYSLNKLNPLRKTIFVNPQILNKINNKVKNSNLATNDYQKTATKTLNTTKTEKSVYNKIECLDRRKVMSKLNSSSVNKYCRTNKQISKNVSIFINPDKRMKYSADTEDGVSTQNGRPKEHWSNTGRSCGTVFINPNFRKSQNQISRQDNIKITSESIDNRSIINVSKQSETNAEKNCENKVNNQISRIFSSNNKKLRTTLNKDPSCLYTNNIMIFINPDFNLSKKNDVTSTCTTEDVLRNFENNVSTLNHNVGCSDNYGNGEHDNIIMDPLHDSVVNKSQTLKDNNLLAQQPNYTNVSKTIKLTSQGILRKRKASGNTLTLEKNRIFVNPEFKTNIFCSNKVENANQTLNRDSVESKIDTTVSRHTYMTSNDNQCEKSKSQISFSNINVQGVSTVGKNMVILNRQSTCNGSKLISLSATKLVRKRKVSQCLRESSKVLINKNLRYLSKTKLIRQSTPNKVMNALALSKVKSKVCVQSTITNILKPTAINTTVTTKIRSKNGRTLKLVRKTIDSVKKMNELSNIKSISVPQKRKHLTSKQLCTLPARSSKTRFSKINVPTIRNTSNANKYVYNNKENSFRKPLTRAAVLTRHKVNNVNKTTQVNNLAEKAKYIKSKYRLVRRLSNVQDQSRRSLVKPKLSYKHLQSPSKRKWNQRKTQLKNSYKRKQFCIVNISGTFYRCSRTSLIRNKPSKKFIGKQNKCRLLNIHGKRFKLENNGQTLTCLDNKVERGRIDIGGITFIKSSTGTSLIRTNYHTARSILRNAKQKSISLLKRNLKKNNEPCLFFHRLGHCSGKERGTCIRQHDPKYIAVCKKFVQGQCSDPNCRLSHSMSCHNMPTCQHFLAGNCGRDHCPYLHIKVNNNAPLCLQFLQGYCPLGNQCIKRHFLICPAFERGACPRGKYCPYPHPQSKHNIASRTKFRTIKRKPLPPRDPEPVSTPSLRYFEDINLRQENEIEVKKDYCEITGSDCATDNEEVEKKQIFTRPKLGSLPSFIPLSSDD